MIHTRTKFIALVALAFFLGACILFIGMVYLVERHKAQLWDEQYRAREAEVQKRALSALEDTVRASADDRKRLASYILAHEEVIEFVTLLEASGKAQGVLFTTESLEALPLDEIFETLSIRATIEGTFDGVTRMVRILENIPEQSSVSSVSFTRESDTGLWSAQVELQVTKFKEIP
jgi:hypothetical protein